MLVIGKPICGISLNGNEYALDDEGNVLTFRNARAAFRFLGRHGISRRAAEDMGIALETMTTENEAGGG